MPAPIPGVNAIYATNKSVRMPKENLKISIRNGKVSAVNIGQVPGGGIPGILKQLNVNIPEMSTH